ncbi:hypothetical protein P7C70_g5491, partial [Phenoliferia sp. Uapishka_3]
MAVKKSGSQSAGNNSPTSTPPHKQSQPAASPKLNGRVAEKGSDRSDVTFPPIKFYVEKMQNELEKRNKDQQRLAAPRQTPATTSRRSSGVTFKGFLARVVVFYLLIAYFLVCPTDTNRSRSVCRALDSVQTSVASYEPTIRPYYLTASTKLEPYVTKLHSKADPYIKVVRPYYTKAGKVIRPLVRRSSQAYSTQAHPRILQAIVASQQFTEPYVDASKATYRRSLAPSVEWYSHAAREWYKSKAAPHVDSVVRHAQQYSKQAYELTSPLYFRGYPLAKKHYFGTVLPAAKTTYKTSRKTYVQEIHPRLLVAGGHTHSFYKSKILPALQRFYSLYVAPQVGKISAKIFEYRTKKEKTEAVAHVEESGAEIVKEHGGEDFEDFISELRDSTYAGEDAKVVAPPPASSAEAPPTPEELKAATAAKRATLEALQATYEKEISKLGQIQQDLLVQRLIEIRSEATHDIPMRFTATTMALDEEGDKMVGKLGKYFDKVERDEKLSTEEKVKDAEFLSVKASAKVKKMATDALAEVADYRHSLESREKAAVELASDALSALVSKAQEELSFGWTWLDDVRHADWQRYHQLAKADVNFKDYYTGIQSGAISDSALSQYKPHADLDEVEKEIKDTVNAFDTILRKITLKGTKELKGEWTGVANEAQKAFEVLGDKVADVKLKADSIRGITPTPTDLQGTASSFASIAQASAVSFASSAREVLPTVPSVPTDYIVDSFSTATENVASVVDQAASVVDQAASAVVTQVPAALESVYSIAASLGEAAALGGGSSASAIGSGATEGFSTLASVISSYASPHPAFASETPLASKISASAVSAGSVVSSLVSPHVAFASETPIVSKISARAVSAAGVVSSYASPHSAFASETPLISKASSIAAQAVSSASSVYSEASASVGGTPAPTNIQQSASSLAVAASSMATEVTKAAGESLSSVASVISSYAAPHPAYTTSIMSAKASKVAHGEL